MKRVLLAALLWTGTALATPQGSVVGSKHDFSSLGGGAFRAATEQQVCIFCHASHGAMAGMNNRPARDVASPAPGLGGSAARSKPTGSSRLCLSCHDGTVAVGDTVVKRIAVSGPGGERIPPGRPSNLGTDLRTSHPVSTPVRQSTKTHAPDARDAVKLDGRGDMQCTSCHDPHRSADAGGKFLVKEDSGSQLCLSCHSQSLGAGLPSTHFFSSASFGVAQGSMDTRSMSQAGCASCHAMHGGDSSGQLLRRTRAEGDDASCLRCHSGAVARKNVAADAAKPYSHSVGGRGVHDPSEGPSVPGMQLPETSLAAPRHAVCVDCHNPHAATDAPAIAPGAGGPLAGVWGIDLNGRRVDPVRYGYEVCLKCHGDSANKPQDRTLAASGFGPTRAMPDTNLRTVFAPSAASYHPIAAPGRSTDVPTLKSPWSTASYVSCTDCHASDAASLSGVARGPHGSIYPHLLERNYTTADNSVESPATYALCYKCHDRDRLLFSSVTSGDSTFVAHASGTSGKQLHYLHVVQQRVPCSVCHASHGVSALSGTPANNAHLIDFDVGVVKPNSRGTRSYAGPGSRSGSCSLSCHGRPTLDHVDVQYN